MSIRVHSNSLVHPYPPEDKTPIESRKMGSKINFENIHHALYGKIHITIAIHFFVLSHSNPTTVRSSIHKFEKKMKSKRNSCILICLRLNSFAFRERFKQREKK